MASAEYIAAIKSIENAKTKKAINAALELLDEQFLNFVLGCVVGEPIMRDQDWSHITKLASDAVIRVEGDY